jgi:alpha-beta hydrolase superfamily lysophospholipase
MFILHGTADKIIEPENAQLLFDLVSSENKQIKLYEGLYHELFSDPVTETPP